jgi:hypothetical protein
VSELLAPKVLESLPPVDDSSTSSGHHSEMGMVLTFASVNALTVTAATGHRGGNAVLWIVGWIIVLAVLAGAVYLSVRRRKMRR